MSKFYYLQVTMPITYVRSLKQLQTTAIHMEKFLQQNTMFIFTLVVVNHMLLEILIGIDLMYGGEKGRFLHFMVHTLIKKTL